MDALLVGFEFQRLELSYFCSLEELLKHTSLQLSGTFKKTGQILQAEQPLIQYRLALFYLKIEVGKLYIDVGELIVKDFLLLCVLELNLPEYAIIAFIVLREGEVKDADDVDVLQSVVPVTFLSLF